MGIDRGLSHEEQLAAAVGDLVADGNDTDQGEDRHGEGDGDGCGRPTCTESDEEAVFPAMRGGRGRGRGGGGSRRPMAAEHDAGELHASLMQRGGHVSHADEESGPAVAFGSAARTPFGAERLHHDWAGAEAQARGSGVGVAATLVGICLLVACLLATATFVNTGSGQLGPPAPTLRPPLVNTGSGQLGPPAPALRPLPTAGATGVTDLGPSAAVAASAQAVPQGEVSSTVTSPAAAAQHERPQPQASDLANLSASNSSSGSSKSEAGEAAPSASSTASSEASKVVSSGGTGEDGTNSTPASPVSSALSEEGNEDEEVLHAAVPPVASLPEPRQQQQNRWPTSENIEAEKQKEAEEAPAADSVTAATLAMEEVADAVDRAETEDVQAEKQTLAEEVEQAEGIVDAAAAEDVQAKGVADAAAAEDVQAQQAISVATTLPAVPASSNETTLEIEAPAAVELLPQ